MPILPKTTNFYENIILFTSEFNRCIFYTGLICRTLAILLTFFIIYFFFTQLYAFKKVLKKGALYRLFALHSVLEKKEMKQWK